MNELLKKVVVGITTMAMVITMVPVVPAVAETPAQGDDRVIFGRMWGHVDLGATGRDVEDLQAVLVEEGLLDADSVEIVVRAYGEETKAAVVAFKHRYETEIERRLTIRGLQKDAYGYGQLVFTPFVGPATMAQVNAIVAQLNYVAEVPVVPVVTDPTVAISAETPAARTVPISATLVDVLKFDLTAGAEDLTISEMKFRRTGLGTTTDWTSLYLFEGDIRITDFGRTISVDDHTINFPVLDITIPAGEIQEFTLRTDVVAAADATVGNQGAFELIDITSNIDITGLPIAGNLMSIGGVPVSEVTLRDGVDLVDPMVGEHNVDIASFEIEADDNAVAVEQIAIEVGGTIRQGDVTNFRLYHDDVLLAETPVLDNQDRAVFILDPMFEVARGETETLTVKADLAGRVRETIKTRIVEDEDVIAIDLFVGGFGAQVTNNVSAPGAIGNIELQGGTLTLADQGPEAADITKDADDVVLTQIGMTADRDLEVRNLRVELTASAGAVIIGGDDPDLITDIRIKDAETGVTLMTGDLPTVATNSAKEVIMSGTFILTAGETRSIVITVDTGDSDDLKDRNIRANLVMHDTTPPPVFLATVRDIVTGDNLESDDFVPHTVFGNDQTIVPAAITSALLPFPIDTTVVAGAANVETMGFRLRAEGEDVIIRNIEAQVYADTIEANLAAGTDKDRNLANDIVILARLMDGATVLDTATLTTTGLARFTGINLPIAVDESKNLVVQISTVSTLPGDVTHYVAVAIDTAEIDAEDVDGNPVNVTEGVINAVNGDLTPRITTVNPSGVLALGEIDPATPDAAIIPVGNLVVGATDVAVTRVRFEADFEPIILERINVQNVGQVAAGNAISTPRTVEIWTDGAMVAEEIFDTNGLANFIGLDIEVPTVGRRVLDIKVDLGGIGHGSESGDTVDLAVEVVRATGKYSGKNAIDTTTHDATMGVKATGGTIAVAGTATAAGDITVTLPNSAGPDHSFVVAVANGDTAIVIANKIRAGITGDIARDWTVDAAGDNIVDLNANITGVWGNDAINAGAVAGITTAETNATGGVDPTSYAMTVRQTVPTVATVAPTDTVLNDGENHIMDIRVTADSAGDVTFSAFTLDVDLSGTTPVLDLTDIIVREGGSPVTVVNHGTLTDGADGNVPVEISPEVIAAGTSKTYSVFAVMEGTAPDDTLVAKLIDGVVDNPVKATVTVDADIVVTADTAGVAGNEIEIVITVADVLSGNDGAIDNSSITVSKDADNTITVAVLNDANTTGNTDVYTVTRADVVAALNLSASAGNVTITDDVTGLITASGAASGNVVAVTETTLANGTGVFIWQDGGGVDIGEALVETLPSPSYTLTR